MAKVDLASAYCCVKIHPDCFDATGLKWKFSGNTLYMYDSRLPFGCSKRPYIFNTLTQSVCRMMKRQGFMVICYMDDFLVIGKIMGECKEGMDCLLALLRKLGFQISWPKVQNPSQNLIFLGVEIDTSGEAVTLRLPDEKLQQLKHFISDFKCKVRASKRQLQSLAGKLNWACQVIRGGRTFLRRIIDSSNKLRAPHHKYKLSHSFYQDIIWWDEFLHVFNGRTVAIQSHIPSLDVEIDASNHASGVYFRGDWLYTPWPSDWPEVAGLHINHKEALSVVLAARRWAPYWANHKVIFHTDSTTARAFINKGTCHDTVVIMALRESFWLSAIHNFEIKAVYLPGKDNLRGDTISRLHEPGKIHLLQSLLATFPITPLATEQFILDTPHHMSTSALSFLSQVKTGGSWSTNWTKKSGFTGHIV